MKRTLPVGLLILALCAMSLQAGTTLIWDPNTATAGCGGTGAWGTNTVSSPAFWTTTCDTAPYSVWTNANVDSAVFVGTGTGVNVTNNITVNVIEFDVGGYSLTNTPTATITFSGTGAGIFANHNSLTTTLVANYAGSLLNKTGAGRVDLNNTGATVSKYKVTGGCIGVLADSRFGTQPGSPVTDFFTLDGGGLAIVGVNSFINTNRGITVGSSGAFFGGAGLNCTNFCRLTGSGPVVFTTGSPFYTPANSASCVWTLFNTANDWVGATAVSGNTLRLGASGVIPNASSLTISNTGTLALNGFDETVGAVTLVSGTISGNGSLTGSSYDLRSGTISAILGGGSTVNATKTTSATVTLSGSNTFAGKTLVTAGQLTLNAPGGTDTALGAAPASPVADQLTVDGAVLALGSAANVVFATNRGFTIGSGGARLQGAQDWTFPGNIVGTGGLYKTNSGNLTLSGTNTFAGDFTIVGGGVRFNGDSTAGQGTLILGPTASILTLRNIAPTVSSTVTNAITINTSTNDIDLTCVTGNTLTFSGNISGAGAMTRARTTGAAGNVVLSGNSSAWSGGLTFMGGTLSLGHKNCLGTGTLVITPSGRDVLFLQASTPLTGANAVNTPVSIAITNRNFNISGANAFELSGTVNLGGVTPVITNNNSGGTILSGTVSSTGAGLTLAGTGVLTLSGTATYTAATTVGSGTLLVNGSLASTTVSVNSGAKLGGGGTVLGAVSAASGATVGAGASAGLLTIGNGLDLSAGATNVWELAANSASNPGVDFDQIALTNGNLVLGGSSVLAIKFIGSATPPYADPFWFTPHSWTIINLGTGTASNPLNSNFATITGTNGLPATFTTTVSGNGSIVLNYQPGPPTIICAANKSVVCGSAWTFDDPTAIGGCIDQNASISVMSTVTNGTCPQIAIRTWQATDSCNQTATCSQYVTNIDTTPPSIACAADKTVDCSSWSFDAPTASDTCSSVTITILSSTTNYSCPPVATRTWVATDLCGNTNTCSQSVTLIDTVPPVFTTFCQTNQVSAGTLGDDFVGPEPTSPSAGLATRLSLIPENLANFDECTNGAVVAHTFNGLPPDLAGAILTVRMKPCGGGCFNDTINISFTDGTGAQQPGDWTRYLGQGNLDPGLLNTNWCVHDPEVFTLDLSALPLAGGGTTNLMPYVNAYGYIDFVAGDDSAVDYIALDLVTCGCATNKTVQCGSVWAFDPPTATDSCCATNVTISELSTVTNGSGCSFTVTRTWQAVDCCNNAATCSQTVNVIDTTPPALSCGTNKTIQCSDTLSFDVPTATDNCCDSNSISIFNLGTTVGGSSCATVYTQAWVAIDCCNNSTTCTQIVTVVDTEPPLMSCASDKTVECGSTWSFDDPSAFDICCGNNVTITNIGTVTGGDTCTQTMTRTWQATDCCGNSTNCSQTVTIIDTTPPQITCASNMTVECGSVWSFPVPTAYDSCCGFTPVTFLSIVTNGNNCSQVVTITWQATDCCSNTATCSQTATIVDTTPPQITCASNKTVQCTDDYHFDPPSALDACCGTNVTIEELGDVTSGSGCSRDVTRTWRATDCCNNAATCSQTITVVDNVPPDITCGTNKTVECGSNWSFDEPTASDNCCGTNVTVSILSVVTNGTACSLSITQTWTATDCCSNSATCSQVVTVVDTTPPQITCASDKTVQCASVWSFDAPSASDVCCGTNVTVAITSTVTNGGQCNQTITRTWTATDCCGNSTNCSQTVTIVDTTPPVITCASNMTVECGSNWSVTTPVAFDNCCGFTPVSLLTLVTNGGQCNQTITFTWQATDCCSNSATCTNSVTIVDTTPPDITCATNKSVACGTTWSFDDPTASDTCCGANVTITTLSTVTNSVGCTDNITRLWQATDCCGNTNSCSQTVTVVSPDCVPPVITSITYASGLVTMKFNSLTCVTYEVQYKNSLLDPSWSSLTTVTGTGAVITVNDSVSGPMRFYRVVCRCH